MTQTQALDILMMGENIYLTGQAGSGKTFLLNQYIGFLKSHKINVGVTASTGIAATHINGQTIHSWAGIGINKELDSAGFKKITGNERLVSRLQSARVLIIDEVSMLHGYRLDLVDTVCRTVRKDNSPFGGLQVILCGDFFQLPPVMEPGQTETGFVFKSRSWSELNLKVCYLKEQHRQSEDSFLNILNGIRTNDISEVNIENLMSRLKKPLPKGIIPTRLYTHNIDVDAINNSQLLKLDSPAQIYPMQSSGDPKLVEFLKKNCLASETLFIKKGAVVMFIKNNPLAEYSNGTLGTIVDFDEDHNPVVKTFSGKLITAVPESWIVEDNDRILAQVDQVPLRLAWAITVHKSQGMSLDYAEIDLSKSFTYGMGYVALSRVRSLEGIRLLGINQTALQVDGEISEMDRVLKRASDQISGRLESMSVKDLQTVKNNYLKSLKPRK
jgi:ATP-dependent exoDNAse (exonuclease V) alpha subunit